MKIIYRVFSIAEIPGYLFIYEEIKRLKNFYCKKHSNKISKVKYIATLSSIVKNNWKFISFLKIKGIEFSIVTSFKDDFYSKIHG